MLDQQITTFSEIELLIHFGTLVKFVKTTTKEKEQNTLQWNTGMKLEVIDYSFLRLINFCCLYNL